MTEYRQKTDQHTAPFTIEVERLTTSEIHHLLKELVWNYRQLYHPGTLNNGSSGNDHEETRVDYERLSSLAWSTLETAFKHKREFNQDFLRDESQGAMDGITNTLIEWTNDIIWPGTTITVETAKACSRMLTGFMKDRLWPFMKVIRQAQRSSYPIFRQRANIRRVYLSSQVLKTGVVLADLPGKLPCIVHE